jgi:hypothetical protein
MPAAPEQAAPQPAPSPTRTTPPPAKTTAPLKTPTPAPPKATSTPLPEVTKTRTTKTTKVTKDKDVAAPSSIALTLHTSKGGAQISSLVNLELEGRAPLRTKSGNSLGSLKEYCLKWNAADVMDTASSGKQKAPTGTQALAASSPLEIPAKPRAIASKLFNIQQRLFLVSDISTVSISSHISPVP